MKYQGQLFSEEFDTYWKDYSKLQHKNYGWTQQSYRSVPTLMILGFYSMTTAGWLGLSQNTRNRVWKGASLPTAPPQAWLRSQDSESRIWDMAWGCCPDLVLLRRWERGLLGIVKDFVDLTLSSCWKITFPVLKTYLCCSCVPWFFITLFFFSFFLVNELSENAWRHVTTLPWSFGFKELGLGALLTRKNAKYRILP